MMKHLVCKVKFGNRSNWTLNTTIYTVHMTSRVQDWWFKTVRSPTDMLRSTELIHNDVFLNCNNFGLMKYSLKSATAQHWEHDLVGCISKSFTWSNLCPTCHMSLSWGIVYCLSAATTHLKFIYVLMRPSRGDLPPDSEALGIHCSCSRQWSHSRSFSRSLQREQQQQQLSMGGEREKKKMFSPRELAARSNTTTNTESSHCRLLSRQRERQRPSAEALHPLLIWNTTNSKGACTRCLVSHVLSQTRSHWRHRMKKLAGLFFFLHYQFYLRNTEPLATRAATSSCRQVDMRRLISHILKSNELQGTVTHSCSPSVHCPQ